MQTILLIEDDSQTRKMLKRMLVDAGYNVREAADGGDRFSDLITGITKSTPFLMRTSQ